MKTTLLILAAIAMSTTLHAEEFKPNYEMKIDSAQKELNFRFNSGQVQVNYDSKSARNDVKCQLDPNTKPKGMLEFGSDYKKFRCEVTISRDLKLKVHGQSGQIQGNNISSESDFSLDNGQIQFSGNPSKNFDFDATVENGLKPMLPMSSSKKEGAPIAIKLHVKNGMISVQ